MGKFSRVKQQETISGTIKKGLPKKLLYKKNKIGIKYLNFGKKTYIFKMEDDKVQKQNQRYM